MSCQEEFKARLRERGFRMTPQREMVLDVLHRQTGHVTAEEVYDQVHQMSEAVDISTVYRTLELLNEMGLVGISDAEGDQRRYELLTVHGPHVHMRCAQCGVEVVVPQAEMRETLDAMAQRYGFYPDLDHVVISGLCKACRARAVDQGTD